jgi:hypothetical protein
MDADSLLEQFTIADPYPMKWDHMNGDNRVHHFLRMRHLCACGKHVHNFTAMSRVRPITPSLHEEKRP